MMKCKICFLEFKNRRGLSKHLTQKHKLNKDSIIEYKNSGYTNALIISSQI